MIGLRSRPRDAALPTLAGEGGAPDAEQVRRWIDELARRPDAPEIERVTWEYARWKPGVSLTCTYAVRFADSSQELVVAKRYADGKDRLLSSRPLRGKHWHETSPRLVPRVAVREQATLLFVQVADRELRGTPFLLDRRKAAHLLRDAGLAPAGTVRRRRLEYTLARYKPERRAVYRLDVRLRDTARTRFGLGCRILPPDTAQRIAATRRRFEQAGSTARTPPLVGSSPRYGVLLEPWLDVTAFPPDAFGHAEQAGAALAGLHRTPGSFATADDRGVVLADLEPLLRVDRDLSARLASVTLPGPGRGAWCHGDYHPDQIARDPEGKAWILDLDLLGEGDPLRDLASWVADAVIELSEEAASESARALLAGYARGDGPEVDARRLWALVADELYRRAAGAIRRLEAGAVRLAARALERARALAPAGVIGTASRNG